MICRDLQSFQLYPVTFQHFYKTDFSGYLLIIQDGIVKKTL